MIAEPKERDTPGRWSANVVHVKSVPETISKRDHSLCSDWTDKFLTLARKEPSEMF